MKPFIPPNAEHIEAVEAEHDREILRREILSIALKLIETTHYTQPATAAPDGKWVGGLVCNYDAPDPLWKGHSLIKAVTDAWHLHLGVKGALLLPPFELPAPPPPTTDTNHPKGLCS